MAAAPTETEIKLVFEPGASADLESHPVFASAASAVPPRRELTRYFDTDDLLLYRHGYSLRIRESEGRIVQTLKRAPRDTGAVHPRNEWEWDIEDASPAWRQLGRVLAAEPALDGNLRRAHPQFETEIQRRSYDIALDGSEIEAVMDDGVVRAGGREEPVREIELEIKRGPLGPVCRLAIELLEHHALRLGAESKADRGYRLLTGHTAAAVKARPPPLPSGATLGEALNRATGSALHGFVANLPAARAGDPEGVHQARVALRRLHSMLVLYADCLEPCARERFNNAIREMGVVLGTARDWDVFVNETLDEAGRAGVPEEWILALKEQAEPRRERSRAAVISVIDSKAPAELVLGVQAWIGDPDWAIRGPHPAQTPVREVMPKLLERMAEKVARRGRKTARLTATELHPLRKSIKKVRYSAESVSALFSRKRVKTYVKACKKLQTILGSINDSRVTVQLLGELAPADSAALAAAAGALHKWNAKRLDAARPDLGKAWRKLRQTQRFWE